MNHGTTFNVRVLAIESRVNARGEVTSYRAAWKVDGRKFTETCKNLAQADAYRSRIQTAAKNAEPFDKATGRPASWTLVVDETPTMGWYELATRFIDMRWPDISAKHRFGFSYLLANATFAMLRECDCPYTAKEVRTALRRWAFNTKHRANAPDEQRQILAWVGDNCEDVGWLAKPGNARELLNAAINKLDGTRASAKTARKHVYMLNSVMRYAVELQLLDSDPIKSLKWEPPAKAVLQVDRRSVVNPHQAKLLLDAVYGRKPSGAYLMPFFATLYYCGLRPEEAVDVRRHERTLPGTDEEWGEFYLTRAAPDVGRDWTDSGEARDDRGLKHRAKGEGRPVPIPPPLVAILRRHERDNGLGPDNRIFFGVQRKVLSTSTIQRLWGLAREDALTEEEQASPLAARPYDLRHACLSTWLNAGISATQVAEWAGNSPMVLMTTYAKCLTGQGDIDKQKIMKVLGDGAWKGKPLALVPPLPAPRAPSGQPGRQVV
ncbi:phage integrase family protein [Actinocorallia herbida]|uniref:Phage integrase family protein n=1 Tax=Actinocorallia herbida TaxID=58109 RepID=A0A3N1DAS0_9ACTN|nr:tyrosine-type recombinase/integrase [Actinocorallia herbida]ROO90599.1 phage integrase family protein [Actinocorallia herbida]